ncbi:hypothetical protein VE03_04386 [Pseudogymnoascus sp. 23342-1-I1]|nr:hypothetical protein VE03_04386 [Pseudogymnoascus sp. 23342-1-I1]
MDVTDTAEEADDEYFDSQDDLSRKTTSTFTQQVVVTEEVTAAEGSGQVTGQITGHVTEVEATTPTGDVTGEQPTSQRVKFSQATSTITGNPSTLQGVEVSQATGATTGNPPTSPGVEVSESSSTITGIPPTSQQVKVTQATGTITGQLPASKDAKQVRISSQVTEVTATQGPTDPPANQTPGPDTGTSTPRSSRSIRKALSAVLDGSPFRGSVSNSETKPQHSTPQPKPWSPTSADPPRPPMLGYEWVWFPGGYWAEREIITRPTRSIRPPRWVRRSLQGSAGSTHGSPVASAPRSLNPSEVWLKHPNDAEEEEEDEIEGDGPRGRRASTPPGRMSPDKGSSTPKSLLQKLHQISHSRKASASGPSRKGKEPEEPRPEPPPIDLERRTINTLRGTSQFFSKFLAAKRQSERAMHPMSPDELLPQRLPRKRFGMAPWHQNASGDTVRTTSSSIRELLFGKTPASTPQPGASLADAKPKEYFGVEVPGSLTDDE